jgi:hypothetical protein
VGHLGTQQIDAIYTDAPWNEGIGKIFRRWAGATGDQFSLRMLALLTAEQFHVICPSGPWFIEVGPHPDLWHDAVRRVRSGCTLREHTWGDTAKPTFIVQSGATLMPTGLHGEETTEWVFNYFIDHGIESVLDPFIGKGLTVRYAIPRGISVYGMELNPKRLAECQKLTDKLLESL